MTLLRRKFSPLIALELEPSASGVPLSRPSRERTTTKGAAWSARLGRLRRALRTDARRAPFLSLELTDKTVTFNGLPEFEFALSSRTEFPVRKVAQLIERAPEELEQVAHQIRQVEKRFADVLARSIQEPGIIGELMRDIEIKLFSQDHDWRDIVEALHYKSPHYDEYRKIALVKYMQYLGSRQDVLRSIYLDKVSDDARPQAPHEDSASAEDAVSIKDTAIFEVGGLEAGDEAARFAEIPRGETLHIQLNPGEPIELRLSTCHAKLFPGVHFYFVDDAGNNHVLRPGQNVLGRHVSCDVVIAAEHRSVSRRHLIIEPVAEDAIRLTDISSHGTFVPSRYL